ncbi:deoxyribonuclease-1-like [Lampris incognitus]|uniref:deoxyribonuclease-1-like n=1 Tax=Lampris incognitus TaxID=2546036 RepID=UPI0024B486FE|nr:deoxyribonuclease-1-like [Lampris incognitus]
MKMAAFNIRKLGWRKVKNKVVLRYLIKIVSRYSVVLILEVVDKTGAAMQWFLQELNRTQANKQHPYSMARSSRLGRDNYKEQFVFLYRENEVQLTDCYQYEDNQPGDEDAFSREPYILRFSCQMTVVDDLVLIPVHTKPEDSEKELDELDDVVQAIRKKWRTDNIMILGDFNADGCYISKRKMGEIRIRSDVNYHWLIGDDVDTTACNCNDHTYDRIVLYGETMLKAVIPSSAKPFNFQKAFHLTDDMALSISDHYPVEVMLRSNAPKKTGVQRPIQKRRPPNPSKKRGASGAGNKHVSGPVKKKDVPTPQRKAALGGPFQTDVPGPKKKRGPLKKK